MLRTRAVGWESRSVPCWIAVEPLMTFAASRTTVPAPVLRAGSVPASRGCPAAACLHWGAMWGPAARADYVDPIGLLATTPIRLKPSG